MSKNWIPLRQHEGTAGAIAVNLCQQQAIAAALTQGLQPAGQRVGCG